MSIFFDIIEIVKINKEEFPGGEQIPENNLFSEK